MNTYNVPINGWSDARQAHRLESELRRLPGVTDASAAPDTGYVIVTAGKDSCHTSRAH
jgi:hypothetical protein